jgi:hypothetical protein
MQIRVVSGSGVPIYRQIADQIARGVANEEWAVGQRISTRTSDQSKYGSESLRGFGRVRDFGDTSREGILCREKEAGLYQVRTYATSGRSHRDNHQSVYLLRCTSERSHRALQRTVQPKLEVCGRLTCRTPKRRLDRVNYREEYQS